MDRSRFEIDASGTARLKLKEGWLLIDSADLHILEEGQIKTKKGTPAYVSLWSYSKPSKRIGSLSRMIMNAPPGLEVDHINHDTLDNRRCNLRVCTKSENSRNKLKRRISSSRFKGVTFDNYGNRNKEESRKWRAYTRVAGQRVYLGYHKTEEDAARAYDEYAKNTFGAFACLNFKDTAPVSLGSS